LRYPLLPRILVNPVPKGKENFDGTADPVSKSQRRRDALEVRSLAARLIAVSPALLARVPLDDPVRAAISEAHRIRANVARKRQLQYVAKLLRRADPEPIVQALQDLEQEGRQATARQHRAEAWRDRLLEAGDPALGELIHQRQDGDAQAIRQLVRRAGQEAARGQPPTAARKLFRTLREMDEREPLPAPPTG
jgi:ribosome-associated protein